MSTHNELYLPQGLLISPQELFCAPSPRQASLYHSIKYRIESKLPMIPADLLQAAYFPHIFESLLLSEWLAAPEIERALQRPDIRCGVLLQNYAAFAPQLEGLLETDMESVERLLVYFRQTNTPPLKDPTCYSRLLEQDPDRYFRVHPTPDDSVRDRILKQTITDCGKAPQYAFFRLKLEPGLQLEADMIRAIQKSDYYSYMAARHLQLAGAPEESWRPLVEKLSAPRWIFHGLRDGLIKPTPLNIDHLCQEPEWAAQWIVVNRASIEELEKIFDLCVANSFEHPLFHDLSLWFQRKRRLLAA